MFQTRSMLFFPVCFCCGGVGAGPHTLKDLFQGSSLGFRFGFELGLGQGQGLSWDGSGKGRGLGNTLCL